MKTSNHKFDIPFVGLKIGNHEFNYLIDSEFFDDLDYSPITHADLEVHLELEKKEVMFIAQFSVKGIVTADCDRCNTPVKVQIQGELKIIYKFGHEESDDENLIVLPPEAYQINVKDPIYQMIILAMPNRVVHPDGECDKEMEELLNRYTINADKEEENENNDPRWSILKNKN